MRVTEPLKRTPGKGTMDDAAVTHIQRSEEITGCRVREGCGKIPPLS